MKAASTLVHQGLELGPIQGATLPKGMGLVKRKPLIGCNRSATGGLFPQRSVPAGQHNDRRSGSRLPSVLPCLGERLVPSDDPGVGQEP
jgi:hypothetical protein